MRVSLSRPDMKYTDLSTLDSFQFIFHCGVCNAGVQSQRYAFHTAGFHPPLSQKARALLWIGQHDEAYARAHGEASLEFNLCSVCGRRVCNPCFRVASNDIVGFCTSCARGDKKAAARLEKKRRPVMLASVTRQYKDLSTPESFGFAFYCDRCGREWRSDTYAFDRRGFESPMDERIHTMLWHQQHHEAYERANLEAALHFNRCPSCGCRICDDCLYTASSDESGQCKDCTFAIH